MPRSENLFRAPTAAQYVLAAIIGGTAVYLVPTLALHGSPLAAAVGAVVWLAGAAVLWLLFRRELREAQEALDEARADHGLIRALITRGAEAHFVVDARGAVVYASPNAARVLGADTATLQDNGGLLARVRRADRRRVLQAFAHLRRQPGASRTMEVGARHPDGGERFLDVRAVNLTDDPVVGGILVTVRDITPRKTFESQIQHLAYYDALTGLANRRFFFEQGGKALALARRHGQPLAVFSVDLDHFRQVNDVLGHEAGDQLLQQVSQALQRSLRDSDVVARLGGDEFAVVLTEVEDVAAAARVARRLVAQLPSAAVAPGHEVPVGASVGIALFPEDGPDLEALLKAADLAMEHAKADGVGIHFYRPELRVALDDQMRLEHDMRRALEHHEFHLHYQPVFHLITGEIVGAEALTRWRHFTRGMVEAHEFIRLAERAGLIRSLDRWAMARAVHQRRTQLDGRWVGWVAVNLSAQSLTDPELPGYVRTLVEQAQLEPGALVLELPEAAVLGDPAAADRLWELKNTGAALALDDYAGASTFAQLKELPVDILKLDPAFVRGLGRDDADEHLVEATLAVAHGIRARVLAKGVERDDQVEWLRDAGCDFIQGYLSGAPVPMDDLSRAVERTTRRHH